MNPHNKAPHPAPPTTPHNASNLRPSNAPHNAPSPAPSPIETAKLQIFTLIIHFFTTLFPNLPHPRHPPIRPSTHAASPCLVLCRGFSLATLAPARHHPPTASPRGRPRRTPIISSPVRRGSAATEVCGVTVRPTHRRPERRRFTSTRLDVLVLCRGFSLAATMRLP